MIRPARRPYSLLATLLALLAIGLRLLLPALHSHDESIAAAPTTSTNQALLGGCGCDTFATAAELTDGDAEPTQHEAAPATFEHACFACDFELAHPPLLPAPATMPATAAIWLRAPPTACRAPASAQCWTRPPSRAPPRTIANA